MPRRKATPYEKTQQPINWSRAVVSGLISTLFMMGFIDAFNMMGVTPFTFEKYLGTLVTLNSYAVHTWTIGFFLNLGVGALIGIFYAYCFEYIYFHSSSRLGIRVAFWHLLLVAFAIFPFFGAIHEFMGTGLFPRFGILGFRLGAPTPILLIAAHLLYGSCMGLFYGPVRLRRVRTRVFEPGETYLRLLSREEESIALNNPVP